MALVRIQGACGGGDGDGDEEENGDGVEMLSKCGDDVEAGSNVFVDVDDDDECLCFGESVGGDEEYLKERGTSMLKGKETQIKTRDASGGKRMTLILIIKSAE
jgi:hypothetical protein